jgi:hypothetical protein
VPAARPRKAPIVIAGLAALAVAGVTFAVVATREAETPAAHVPGDAAERDAIASDGVDAARRDASVLHDAAVDARDRMRRVDESARTRIKFGKLELSDNAARDQIAPAFTSAKDAIGRCFDGVRNHAARNADIELVVAVDGGLTSTRVTGLDQVAAECVRSALDHIQWGRLPTEDAVIVKTSFTITLD